jgi:hypothetical protein
MPSQSNNPFSQPPVPTMTNKSLIPAEPEPRSPFAPAEELGEDIVALPMGGQDLAVDVKPHLVNQNLYPRWIFTDRRRYTQAKAQGWRNAVKADFKPSFTGLSPFEEEGGTKYINGDIILMLIKREIYLGALRYKHQVAANLADAAIQKRVSAGKAVQELGSTVAAVNQRRAASGADPVMTVFTPGAGDFKGPMADPATAAKELGRLGHSGARDTGTLSDLANEKTKT